MNWDDMKVLLALGRRGSARGAAQLLGVSNSTITRRLDDLESTLHTRLFDRTPDGYRMTAAAEELMPAAEHVEELMLAAERRITGTDQQLQGSIRLTMPDRVEFLLTRLARFAEDYPGIELELMPSNLALDLSRREADIAVRVLPAGARPPDNLIGRNLCPLSASTYVHRALLREDAPHDVSHLTWVGRYPQGQREDWLRYSGFEHLPVRHAISDLNLMQMAARSRMGLVFMPCFLAFGDPELVRVPDAPVVHQSNVWVLTHRDLRLSARFRVLREVIAEEFAKVAAQLDTR
ncbi:LysR family transcriptional regulator [Haliea salexigens]|uniref:LysR family transcriptional regulator n=1 Tax=Haliea salexigens TaxID=287487 RepID=UPI0003FD168E|nr:LysR family transcriptional regulator [Haliea salexigens]MAA87236.1 LysR family transcriptional regulator [Haliea sp.]